MSDMEISKVLSQLRTLAGGLEAPGEKTGTAGAEFGSLLKESVESVNTQQQKAVSMAGDFEAGRPGVDLAEVMIAAQKASVSFQGMTEVRNKLVEAYREIMNMPI